MSVSKFNGEGYFDLVPHAALTNIKKEARAWKPLVYVASPYAGDTETNTRNAIRYCRFVVDSGAIPVAPHLYLPQFMSEEKEREEAMRMNKVFLSKCRELWLFGSTITEGMKAEIRCAKWRGMPIRRFTEDCQEYTEEH